MIEPFLTSRLADFLSWRDKLESQIDTVRRAMSLHQALDDDTLGRFDLAMQQVRGERLTIAFVAEAERGKSELINALFFSERGRRMLPSGPGRSTLCVTELRFDRDWPPCMRLLPIETRERPERFSELVADEGLWKVIPFVYEDSDSIQRALGSLSEVRRVTLGEAVAWGLHRDVVARAPSGNGSLVDVPRWRHAIINMPHPILQAGLVVLDTPGMNAMAAEPELSRQRIPDADCVVFVLDINAHDCVSKSDLTLWREYLGGGQVKFEGGVRSQDAVPANRLVALNKIDVLYDTGLPNADLLRAIDRKVKEAADLLRVDPIKVVPLSARFGFLGKTTNDRDKLVRSRLYQLERGITQSLGDARQRAIGHDAQRTLSDAVGAARERLDEERYALLEHLRELGDLREKNRRIVSSVADRNTTQSERISSAGRELRGLRAIHTRLGDELAVLVDVKHARSLAKQAATSISGSLLPAGIELTVNAYLEDARARVLRIEEKINEIKAIFGEVFRRMRVDYAIPGNDVLPFPTQRFHTELQKIETDIEGEFKRTSNLFLRRGSSLGEQFLELVGNRVVHVFEIAARESIVWMRGLLSSLEKPLESHRETSTHRADGLEKLREAELELAEKIAELQARMDVLKARHAALMECEAVIEPPAGDADEVLADSQALL